MKHLVCSYDRTAWLLHSLFFSPPIKGPALEVGLGMSVEIKEVVR
jgi:hypothetical protein